MDCTINHCKKKRHQGNHKLRVKYSEHSIPCAGGKNRSSSRLIKYLKGVTLIFIEVVEIVLFIEINVWKKK